MDCYWPEFTVWRFIGVLLDFQVSKLRMGTGRLD